MTIPGPLLILTMPGFGVETLRELVQSPAWPAAGVSVALVGPCPPVWRRTAAWVRHTWRRAPDRVHRLADSTLSARDAERFLRAQHVPWSWLASDDAVRAHRTALRPALTLTITSRILFSPRTLAEPGGEWLNVHPGLLPEYAGASPAPYMFLDGIGGCTIHWMAAQIDGGDVVDRAPMPGPLGQDGGEYLFQRLPRHTASRIAALLQQWSDGQGWPCAGTPGQRVLRHCSSQRLAADRQLDWRLPVDHVVRWVRALSAIAPAWWDDGQGRRVEVMAAERAATSGAIHPGIVQSSRGRWVEVMCESGAVSLRCRTRVAVRAGQRLPLRGSGAGK